MKTLRIAFANFNDKYDVSAWLTALLSRRYRVERVGSSEHPDILFFSLFGYDENFRCRDAVRVYITQENDVPNFNICDYGVSFHDIRFADRSLRLPNYCYHNGAFGSLRRGKRMMCDAPTERGFCSVVVSNDLFASPMRTAIWDAVGRYKPVASGGRLRNNVGGPVADKMEFLSRYKFNLAFENSEADGYTTEKITDAFYAGTVPIYWGNRLVSRDFNPDSFIRINDFASVDEAVAYIRRVDEDDDLYLRYLRANPLLGNQMLDWEERLLDFLRPAAEGRRHLTDYGVSTDFNNLYLAARIRKASARILPNDNKLLLKAKERIYRLIYRKK